MKVYWCISVTVVWSPLKFTTNWSGHSITSLQWTKTFTNIYPTEQRQSLPTMWGKFLTLDYCTCWNQLDIQCMDCKNLCFNFWKSVQCHYYHMNFCQQNQLYSQLVMLQQTSVGVNLVCNTRYIFCFQEWIRDPERDQWPEFCLCVQPVLWLWGEWDITVWLSYLTPGQLLWQHLCLYQVSR